jgi:hypothetical protein
MSRQFLNVVAVLFSSLVVLTGPLKCMAQNKNEPESPVAAELKQIYEADQGDRVGPNAIFGKKDKWAEMRSRDEERRVRVHQLLAEEKVKSADDYYHAAMILQHGTGPQDFLLAHILAGAAAQLGLKKAKWLAAASLDRYLQGVGQPQVFGTQYLSSHEDGSWTQEPFSAALLTDSLRQVYDVPLLAETRQRLKEYQSQESKLEKK